MVSDIECKEHDFIGDCDFCPYCEIDRLREALQEIAPRIHELECMLLSNAKSKRAYEKMEVLAEQSHRIAREALKEQDGE